MRECKKAIYADVRGFPLSRRGASIGVESRSCKRDEGDFRGHEQAQRYAAP
jgi:hypothetical protein